MTQMMMCTLCMSNYYFCDFFKIINNNKIEESDKANNDVDILHIKIYTI
jgi:hypothetical protein